MSVVLVLTDSSTPDTNEQAQGDFLAAAGHTVGYRRQSDANTAPMLPDATPVDVIVHSSNGSSADAARYAAHTIGIVASGHLTWNDYYIRVASQGLSFGPETDIALLDHAITTAAGLTVDTVYTAWSPGISGRMTRSGWVGSDLKAVARAGVGDSDTYVWAGESGGIGADGSTVLAGRRVGFTMPDFSACTTTMQAVFLAAVEWAAGSGGGTVPETAGTLPLTLALSGQGSPVVSSAGSLPLTLTLSGIAEAITIPEAAGTLGLTLTLSGVASTVASTTGALSLSLAVDSAASPVATTTGTLDLTLGLSGTATDGATTGTLGITLTLSGVAENLTPPPVPVTEFMPAGPDPLTSHRVESWRVDLLTGDDAPLGTLDGVTGGAVEQNVNRVISGGGTLDVVDRGQDIPWLSARVQVWWQVAGVEPWPLGVFLCSAPVEQHSSVGLSWRVELLDKLLVLDEDKVDGSYSLAAGTVVTDAVRTIITSAGETAVAITDSAETLTSGMAWEAGTSKLRIINDLLSAINYFSLRCDGYGRYVAAPYLAPASRPVVRRFVPGPGAIHLPEFTRDRDLAGIPNKTVLISSGSSDDEALVGVASNTDPDSPTSQPSRGRWIVHSEEGVEATSQTVIDNLAARRLIDLSTVTATEQIQHAAIPLDLNDVVALSADDLPEVRAAVQSWSLTLSAGSLMRTSIREVAA